MHEKGILTLSNATSDVTFNLSAVTRKVDIVINCTNCLINGLSKYEWTIPYTGTSTFNITADGVNYVVPDKIEGTSSKITYAKQTRTLGILTIKNPLATGVTLDIYGKDPSLPALTYHWPDTLDPQIWLDTATRSVSFSVNFTNAKGTSYSKIGTTYSSSYNSLRYTTSAGATQYAYRTTTGWNNTNDQTITFETEPTGTLLSFLQKYAEPI